jgi:hypothetical protein
MKHVPMTISLPITDTGYCYQTKRENTLCKHPKGTIYSFRPIMTLNHAKWVGFNLILENKESGTCKIEESSATLDGNSLVKIYFYFLRYES